MNISLDQVGKRYQFEWIFRGVDYQFKMGQQYAVLGSNGSGKSTLMKVLAGHLTPSKGKVIFSDANDTEIARSVVYQQVAFAGPYIELIEEFSMEEMIRFHQKFKSFIHDMTVDEVMGIIDLPKTATKKEIKFFSSGMKQRVKLALAILTDSSLLLLDEPTTNLDQKGMAWYLDLVQNHLNDRTVIVASNEERDYGFCDNHINILDYKRKKKA